MKKRILITGAAILTIAVVLTLALHRRSGQPRITAFVETEPIIDQATQKTSMTEAPAATLRGQQGANVLRTLALPPSATPLARAIAKTNLYAAHRLALWQTPIEFYGKVTDEDSNPVAGATATFNWVEAPVEDGNRHTNLLSDAEGLFSLHGAHGPDLGVLVSKEGYYPRNGSARYGPAKAPEFSADSRNPVVFRLRKKGQGAELVTAHVAVRIPKDDTAVRFDLSEKQPGASGQLEISQRKPDLPVHGGIVENLSPADYAKLVSATNWSFRMSIPDGGLVENMDEFQFEAPDKGYQRAVEYHFTKGETNWARQATKQFYIIFGEPRRFGWLRIESNLDQETVFLTYAINPTGSRNLEPVEAKPQAPAVPSWAPLGTRAVIPEIK